MAAPVVIAVSSGKGGVGKSTVSLNLALALAAGGRPTGLLDADIYGPDIPLIGRHYPAGADEGSDGLAQPEARADDRALERFGIKMMSTQFLIGENQALSWSAPLVEVLLQRFTDDIAWGEIDFLVIDLPPGTADIQQQLARRLPLAGALVVITPQDAAHLDAKKALAMFDQMSVPNIEGVENMSGLVCPCCSSVIEVFTPMVSERSIWSVGVTHLVQVPIHRSVADDGGRPLLVERPGNGEAEAFHTLARCVMSWDTTC